jgi:hypothetical protein
MKKNLIAIAALAACNMAFAGVTVTGEVGMGYAKTQPAPGVASDPSKVDGTTELQFTSGNVEVKGEAEVYPGYTAKGAFSYALKRRDSNVPITASGGVFQLRDWTTALLTPIGQITFGRINTETDQPRAFAGSKIELQSDAKLSGGDDIDVLAFTTKLMGVYTTLSYSEGGTQDVLDLANALGGQMIPISANVRLPLLNGGSLANQVNGGPGPGMGPVQIAGLNLTYEEGPLSVGFSFSDYKVTLNGAVQDRAGAELFKAAYDGRQDTELSVSYDFGVVKVGGGYHGKTKGWGNETKAGFSIPMGPWSFGMTYEVKADDSASIGRGAEAYKFASGSLAAAAQGDPTKLAQTNIGDFSGYFAQALGLPGIIGSDLKGGAKRTKIRFGVDYEFDKHHSVNFSYGSYELGNPERRVTGLPGVYQPGNITTTESQARYLFKF